MQDIQEETDSIRIDYGSGEWDTEPDRAGWVDDATGLPCIITRHEELGFWRGYVGVPASHPFFGMDCDKVPVDCHGGLTFAGFKTQGQELWWLGFDCGHAWDLVPGIRHMIMCRDGVEPRWMRIEVYRNVDFAKAECTNLAQQIKAYTWTKYLQYIVVSLPTIIKEGVERWQTKGKRQVRKLKKWSVNYLGNLMKLLR